MLLAQTLNIAGMANLLILHDASAVVVITALAAAVVSVGWNIQNLSGKDLGLAVKRIQILAYSGTFLLALTVFEFNRLTVWATSATKEMTSLVGAFSIGTGLVFTFFLFLIFVPPSLQGAARIQALMATASENEDFDKDLWLLRNELPSSPLQHLATIGSFLLPVASGLLSNLIKL